MDQRKTFDSPQALQDILDHLFQNRERVSLLIDSGGITRMEGMITALEQDADTGKTLVILDQTDRILLNQIIAVNGQFRSDYTEC